MSHHQNNMDPSALKSLSIAELFAVAVVSLFGMAMIGMALWKALESRFGPMTANVIKNDDKVQAVIGRTFDEHFRDDRQERRRRDQVLAILRDVEGQSIIKSSSQEGFTGIVQRILEKHDEEPFAHAHLTVDLRERIARGEEESKRFASERVHDHNRDAHAHPVTLQNFVTRGEFNNAVARIEASIKKSDEKMDKILEFIAAIAQRNE